MNKNSLSERDICTQLIVPALQQAGWGLRRQVWEEGQLKARVNAARAKHVELVEALVAQSVF